MTTKRFLTISAVLATLHFALSWISFTRSEVIRPDASTPTWRLATEILAFPLLWLQKLNPGFDVFAPMMVLNSVLWGAVFGGCIVLVWRLLTRPQTQT